MQTSNGQNALSTTKGKKKKKQKINEAKRFSETQIELLDFIQFYGPKELCKSLKQIHDLALYHSDIPFDKDEKIALFDLKMLWEALENV
jgi:hypothetical protein